MTGDPSHFDETGRVRMVDIGGKPVSSRRARAEGRIAVSAAVFDALERRLTPKGDPLEVARIAAISAAKKTSEWIPLCHPLRLNTIEVTIVPDHTVGVIDVTTTVSAEERTGVEMEALVACSAALLTIYDMLKALDHGMVIGPIRLLEKTGGKSDFTAPPAP